MDKEEYISSLIDSMQTTIDTFNKEVLIAINRDEVMLKEKAFSAYAFNACLMGVDFVYINVCISALAALKADNEHAKRYHWKNVVAGISEGIKYIYTFKENEKKTLIRYLTTIKKSLSIFFKIFFYRCFKLIRFKQSMNRLLMLVITYIPTCFILKDIIET